MESMRFLPWSRRPEPLPPAELSDPDWDATQLAVAQYTSLRSEIVQLTHLQSQVISLTVVAFGTLLSVGFQARNAAIILVYPILSLVLGIIWLYEAHLITRIAAYLRTGVEARVGQHNLGWEHYVQDHPLPRGRFAYWGLRSVFPVTSALAIAASFAVAAPAIMFVIACVIAFAITLLTIVVFILWREPAPELFSGRTSRPRRAPSPDE